MMMPFYADQTMWGPQGDPNKERPRLKPGDRLSDGRIFMGDSPEMVLRAALERVQDQLRPLEAQRDELLAKLAELAPEKPNPESSVTAVDPAAAKPKAKRG